MYSGFCRRLQADMLPVFVNPKRFAPRLRLRRWIVGLALCAAAACTASGSAEPGAPDEQVAQRDPMGSATETNVAPVRCDVPADCAPGRTCVHASAGES